MKNITLGQFFPGDSFIYRLDPRTKLILTVAMIVLLFIIKGFSGFALALLFILLCAFSTKISLKYLFGGLKPLFFIIILTFLLNMFLQKSGEEIHIWFITFTTGGLHTAFFMAFRLILLVISSQVLTLTTSPIALTDGMESLMMPLAKLHFPAHEVSMMMSIALRFIPTLMEETDKIKRAQMSRGADFESGNLLRRVKVMIPLLVPLFVSAFRRADELAMAMEARCYRGGEGRTKMKVLHYGMRDLIALGIVIIMYALIIVMNMLKLP